MTTLSLLKKSENSFLALLFYVDDILLIGNDLNDINSVKESLDKTFKIKALGQAKFFLGLEIARSQKGIHVCQRKYTIDLLANTGMTTSKSSPTPMVKNVKTMLVDNPNIYNIEAYRCMIGKLLYLTNTGPNITYVSPF